MKTNDDDLLILTHRAAAAPARNNMSLIHNLPQAIGISLTLKKLGLSFNYERDGKSFVKFLPFFKELTKKVWSAPSTGEAWDHATFKVQCLEAGCDPFTWSILKGALLPKEQAHIAKYTEPGASGQTGSEGMEDYLYTSPLTGETHTLVGTTGATPPWPPSTDQLQTWALQALFGDEYRTVFRSDLAAMRLSDPSPASLQFHNYSFAEKVANYCLAGGVGPEVEFIFYRDLYLGSLPTSLKDRLGALPSDLTALYDHTLVIAKSMAACRTDTTALVAPLSFHGTGPNQWPTSPKHNEAYPTFHSSPGNDAPVQGIVAALNATQDPNELAVCALSFGGNEVNKLAIAEATSREHALFRQGLQQATRVASSAPELLAAIHTLAPNKWTRTRRLTTETTGSWDMDNLKSEQDIHSSRKRMISLTKQKHHLSDDEEEEGEEPTTTRRSKRKKTTKRPSSMDLAVHAIGEQLLALQDHVGMPRTCRKCKSEGHYTSSCPTLANKDGTYKQWCTFCRKEGHVLGPFNAPTCPALTSYVCKKCNGKGHTPSFCPKNV